MPRQILIIHGWSDSSASFRPLASFLSANGYQPKLLWLGDYISKDDDVGVPDVAKRMAEVIDAMIASRELEASFDMIVHSTGGLVARQWLTTRYRGMAEQCPVKRLVMLAPANYGSKLAAAGKSFLGRVIKGYDNWFESGRTILDNLELASPFQWQLAQRDILIAPGGDAARYYGSDRLWPFVISGTHPYTSLLRQIVNENGADGAVRVCAANLNAHGVTIDFRERTPDRLFRVWPLRLECKVPLAVLPTRTHGSIIDPKRSSRGNREDIAESEPERQQLGQCLLAALACKDFDEYRAISENWEAISEATAERRNRVPPPERVDFFHQYMQMNSAVIDDHGYPVRDYFLEFFSGTSRAHDEANVYLHRKVLEDVKINTRDASLRNLYFDRTALFEGYFRLLPSGTPPTLFMSISAASPGDNVNYFESEKVGAQQQVALSLEGDRSQRWLQRNSTHFVQIIVPRMPRAKVFRLTNFAHL